MTLLAWPEIEGFHNIRKWVRVDPGEWWQAREQLSGTSTVRYKCKVKLHGTNAAVQLLADGTIVCQSRESIITPEKDNAGFARWVDSNKKDWLDTRNNARAQVVIYGEWCGPGIQKNVAVAEVAKKFFAVFAARPLDSAGNPLEDILWVDPKVLQEIVQGIPDVYVLPWHSINDGRCIIDATLDIDWRKTDEELSQTIAPVNDWVLAVEANDPWVEATFGNKGTGEGLVFYPVSKPHLGWQSYNYLVFKAKGEKHKNIKTAAPAQVNPEVAASAAEFTGIALTEARLEQGAGKVALTPGSYDQSQTGKFIQWILGDVQKETKDELEASGLTWKQVEKLVTTKAREWYKKKSMG